MGTLKEVSRGMQCSGNSQSTKNGGIDKLQTGVAYDIE
jgi:hypothetical protein